MRADHYVNIFWLLRYRLDRRGVLRVVAVALNIRNSLNNAVHTTRSDTRGAVAARYVYALNIVITIIYREARVRGICLFA